MELPPNGQGRSFRAAKNFKGNVTVQKNICYKTSGWAFIWSLLRWDRKDSVRAKMRQG